MDPEEDEGPINDFASVIRREDGTIYVDHNGDLDVAISLLTQGIFFLISPGIPEAD
jgi:hypothetical protein